MTERRLTRRGRETRERIVAAAAELIFEQLAAIQGEREGAPRSQVQAGFSNLNLSYILADE